MKKPFNKKKYIKNKIKQFYKDKKKNGDKKRVCKNCRLTYENKFTKLHMSNICSLSCEEEKIQRLSELMLNP